MPPPDFTPRRRIGARDGHPGLPERVGLTMWFPVSRQCRELVLSQVYAAVRIVMGFSRKCPGSDVLKIYGSGA